MTDASDRDWLGLAARPRRNFLALATGIGGMIAAMPRLASAATAGTATPPAMTIRKIQGEATTRFAILDGLARYCRALDRVDRALQETVWHADATAQYTDDPAGPYLAAIDGFEKFIATKAQCHHRIAGNVYIEVNGDRAVSETYLDAVLHDHPTVDGTVVESVVRGRILDRWTMRDGRWAIQHRRFLSEMFEQNRYNSAEWPASAKRLAKHDRTDESYMFFADA